MSELKRVWHMTVASYAGAFFLLLLIASIPRLEIYPTLIAVVAIVGILWLATQKFKIFVKRHELLSVEDLGNTNTKIFWVLMVGEYFFSISFALVLLFE